MTPQQQGIGSCGFWLAHSPREVCGTLLGFVDGFHVRCIHRKGHTGPHVDRTGQWWT